MSAHPLPLEPRLAEVFFVPSDMVMGAFHVFPSPAALKRHEAEEHHRLAVEKAHQEHADFRGAREHLLEALRLCPDYVDALVALGDVERNPFNPDADPASAAARYDAALRLDPQSARALLGRLYTLIDLRDFAGAERAYRELLSAQPRFMKYTNAERFEAEAKQPFGVFYSRKRHLQVLKVLGDAYYAARRWSEAGARFRSVAEADSRDIEVRLAMAFALYRARELEAAEAELMQLSTDVTSPVAAYLNYRVWFAGEWIVPLAQLGHTIDYEGIRATALNLLGLVQLARGLDDRAAQIFRLTAAGGAGTNNLAVVELRAGNTAAAVKLLEASERPESAFNLALIHERDGRPDLAASSWSTFLQRHDAESQHYGRRSARRYVETVDPRWRELAVARLEACQEVR